MAAKVESTGNNTKEIKAALKELDGELGDIDKALSGIKKAKAQIEKNPDECAGPAKELIGLLTGLVSATKDLGGVAKTLAKAVGK